MKTAPWILCGKHSLNYVISHNGQHIQTFFTQTLEISFINEHDSNIFQPLGLKNVLESTHKSLNDTAQLQL